MSDDQFDDLFDDEGQPKGDTPPGPEQLREAYKRLKTKYGQATQERDEARKAFRETTVKQFLRDKGIDESAADEIGNRDPQEWYDANVKFFGNPAPQEDPPNDEGDTKPKGQPAVTPEQIAAMKQVGNVQPGNFVPGSDEELHSKLDDLEKTAKSRDEFYAGLAQLK